MDIIENLKKYTVNKPKDLVVDDVKWKYLVRSTLRGKNVLIVGPTGCGKSFAAITAARMLNRPLFVFNLGSTQDARCSLIGNTNFDKNTGTTFDESGFVKAIRTENSVILLDELSRAHHDSVNILMTVLDPIQRYLRLDEKKDNEVVKVANGVTFIATANIGNEYTATRIMDRALMNRFPVKIEMEPLKTEDEIEYLTTRFGVTDGPILENIKILSHIAEGTRTQCFKDDGKLTNFISTRDVVEMVELLLDGFSTLEIVSAVIYPNFDRSGGVESERMYVKALVQKYIPDGRHVSKNIVEDMDTPF